MNKTIRRFAVVATLSVVLSTTPVFAASRDAGRAAGRDDSSITRVIRIIKKVLRLSPMMDIVPPIPVDHP